MVCQKAIRLLREDSVARLAGLLASSARYVVRRNPPCRPRRSIVSESRSSRQSIPHCTHHIGERFIWKNLPQELFRPLLNWACQSLPSCKRRGRFRLAHSSILRTRWRVAGRARGIQWGRPQGGRKCYRHCQKCKNQAFPLFDAYPKTGFTEANRQAKSVQHTLAVI